MAIKVKLDKQEGRERDAKRKRVVLSIGSDNYHLSQKEASKLITDLLKITKK